MLPFPLQEIAWSIAVERRMEASRRRGHGRRSDVRRRLARALVRAALAIDPQAWRERVGPGRR